MTFDLDGCAFDMGRPVDVVQGFQKAQEMDVLAACAKATTTSV